jgi:hypothetical protein
LTDHLLLYLDFVLLILELFLRAGLLNGVLRSSCEFLIGNVVRILWLQVGSVDARMCLRSNQSQCWFYVCVWLGVVVVDVEELCNGIVHELLAVLIKCFSHGLLVNIVSLRRLNHCTS